MNLEEIINAAVQKRIADLVEHTLNGDPVSLQTGAITLAEMKVINLVEAIANDEIRKHEPAIRAAIRKGLDELPTWLEISAYHKLKTR